MYDIVDLLAKNWEYIAIGILAIDKIVALSPTEWDDLLWTSVKKSIYKITGKKNTRKHRLSAINRNVKLIDISKKIMIFIIESPTSRKV